MTLLLRPIIIPFTLPCSSSSLFSLLLQSLWARCLRVYIGCLLSLLLRLLDTITLCTARSLIWTIGTLVFLGFLGSGSGVCVDGGSRSWSGVVIGRSRLVGCGSGGRVVE